MWLGTHPTGQTLLQSLDLFVRQRRKLSVEPHKANDTGNLQHTQAIDNRHPNK
jgi:hypothetical protein